MLKHTFQNTLIFILLVSLPLVFALDNYPTQFTTSFYIAIGLVVLAVIIIIVLFILLKKHTKPKWEKTQIPQKPIKRI